MEDRTQNKLGILHALKKQGVWLLDASLAALYPKPKNKAMYEACINKSWPYIQQPISAESPEQIIVIGKGVGQVLRVELEGLGIPWDWVYQPQARLTADEHIGNYQRLFDLIHGRSSAGSNKSLKQTNPIVHVQSNPKRRNRIPEAARNCNWTYNQHTGYYSQCVPLNPSTLMLNLWFRTNSKSPRSIGPEVKSHLLDLRQLLALGFVRYDAKRSGKSHIRILIVRDENGAYYIQSRDKAPRYLLD
jgi:hypothetical protein